MSTVHFYLWNQERDFLKKQIADIKRIYLEKIAPVFSDAEHEVDLFAQKIWDDFNQQPYDPDNEPDFEGFSEHVEEEKLEQYQLWLIMQYRSRAMWMECLSQVWEQQVSGFITRQLEFYGAELHNEKGLKIQTSSFDKNRVEEIFNLFQVDLNSSKSWNVIMELRWLVNTFKHGDGDSCNKLKNQRPDLFCTDDALDFPLAESYSTLLGIILKITDDDFNKYSDAIIDFWDELPERMYLK